MEQVKNYITPEGAEKLRAEYAQLFHGERPKLVEMIAWAASNGDRSENADYIYGKRRLREIDSRLRFLSGRLENAMVVDPKTVKSSKVVFGATVTLISDSGTSHCYQIVGEDEWNIELGRISWKSPVARALLGKSEGDEVVIRKPSGEEHVTLEKVEFK